MIKFKYTLNLKTSLKSIFVFVISAFVFFDMRKSFLLTHTNDHWGLVLISFGVFVNYSFIVMGFYFVFLNYHNKNNRIVFYDHSIVIPGFLKLFKEIEVENSEIILVEVFGNQKFKFVKIQLINGKKYEFSSEFFSSKEDFNNFIEVLKSKFGDLVVYGSQLE